MAAAITSGTARFVKEWGPEVLLNSSYTEVHVYDGRGERTGKEMDRSGLRGSRTVCRSVTELSLKARRLGDGYYYLAEDAWPSDATSLDLYFKWSSMG